MQSGAQRGRRAENLPCVIAAGGIAGRAGCPCQCRLPGHTYRSSRCRAAPVDRRDPRATDPRTRLGTAGRRAGRRHAARRLRRHSGRRPRHLRGRGVAADGRRGRSVAAPYRPRGPRRNRRHPRGRRLLSKHRVAEVASARSRAIVRAAGRRHGEAVQRPRHRPPRGPAGGRTGGERTSRQQGGMVAARHRIRRPTPARSGTETALSHAARPPRRCGGGDRRHRGRQPELPRRIHRAGDYDRPDGRPRHHCQTGGGSLFHRHGAADGDRPLRRPAACRASNAHAGHRIVRDAGPALHPGGGGGRAGRSRHRRAPCDRPAVSAGGSR